MDWLWTFFVPFFPFFDFNLFFLISDFLFSFPFVTVSASDPARELINPAFGATYESHPLFP